MPYSSWLGFRVLVLFATLFEWRILPFFAELDRFEFQECCSNNSATKIPFDFDQLDRSLQTGSLEFVLFDLCVPHSAPNIGLS